MAKPQAPDLLVPGTAPCAACWTPHHSRTCSSWSPAPSSPGRRTVTAARSVRGRRHRPTFANVHRGRNRNRWSRRAVAWRLLALPVGALVLNGPVDGGDETRERRLGSVSGTAVCSHTGRPAVPICYLLGRAAGLPAPRPRPTG